MSRGRIDGLRLLHDGGHGEGDGVAQIVVARRRSALHLSTCLLAFVEYVGRVAVHQPSVDEELVLQLVDSGVD